MSSSTYTTSMAFATQKPISRFTQPDSGCEIKRFFSSYRVSWTETDFVENASSSINLSSPISSDLLVLRPQNNRPFTLWTTFFKAEKSNQITTAEKNTKISKNIEFGSFVIRTEIVTTLRPKLETISVCKTKVYKIYKHCKPIFSSFYIISQPNFAISLILVGCFQVHWFDCISLSRSNCSPYRVYRKK